MALSCFLLLVFLSLIASNAQALGSKAGREGDLGDKQAQEDALDTIFDHVDDTIKVEEYYPPGPVSTTTTEISGGLRLHTSLVLYRTGSCFGEGIGEIFGNDLIEAFGNQILPTVVRQIQNGFGFGVVVDGSEDQNLLREGLSAQFYYWVERIGGSNPGGDTPNTNEGKGPSDNNSHRHDELSTISVLGTSHQNKSFMRSMTNNSTLFLKKTLPPNAKSITTNHFSMGTSAQKDFVEECLPYNYALFTSLYDINVITSPSRQDGYPNRIYSPNKIHNLIMQDDCNLVLYSYDINRNHVPVWACGDACYNKGRNCFARINLDGTFAVYNGDGNAIFYTPSQCPSGLGCWSNTYLAMQDDGNVVLYLLETDVPIWATNTND